MILINSPGRCFEVTVIVDQKGGSVHRGILDATFTEAAIIGKRSVSFSHLVTTRNMMDNFQILLDFTQFYHISARIGRYNFLVLFSWDSG